MDFTTNYCGMYWSDGTIQSSVVGHRDPVSELDAACMRHDAAYAVTDDVSQRVDADNKFYSETSGLGLRGKVYGNLVKYGNKLARDAEMAFFLPLMGLIGTSAATTFGFSQVLGHPKRPTSRVPVDTSGGIVYGPSDPPARVPTSTTTYPSPSSGTPAQGEDCGNGGCSTALGLIAKDPELLSNVVAAESHDFTSQRLYKPLRKKKARQYTPGKLEKAKKLHAKYNPPVNKTKNIPKQDKPSNTKSKWFRKSNAVHVDVKL